MNKNPLLALSILLAFVHPLGAQSSQPAVAPALTMSVSQKGELLIKQNQKFIADGHWTLTSSTWQAGEANQIPIGELVSTQVVQISPTHAIVTDHFTAAKAICNLQLDGEDLRLQAKVQNLDATHTLKKISFIGPTFHFAKSPQGSIPSWHWTYLQHDGMPLFHPSIRSAAGVVYAHDDQFGIAAFSATEFDRQSLINANWQQPTGLPNQIQIEFYTDRVLQPSTSADVDFSIRITNDISIPHLLAEYKQVYAQHFSTPLYHADHRLVAQFASTGESLISRTNPLGFNGDFRRLDLNVGVRAYAYRVGAPLHAAGALGIIFWSPGGWTPPMYPPDFDVFPKTVQTNIPTLVSRFKQQGLRVGLCARCGDGIARESGKPPVIRRLDAQNQQDMQQLRERFEHAIGMGFDLFYLDSFGAEGLNDVAILKQIRQWVGPDVLLYTEFCSDQSLPYADHYCEWVTGGILWTPFEQLATLKYLDPDATWLCMSRENRIIPPEFAKWGLTPLIQDVYVTRLPASQPNR